MKRLEEHRSSHSSVSHGDQLNSYLKMHKCSFYLGELQLIDRFILKGEN